MSGFRATGTLRIALFGSLALAGAATAGAQETVTISVPWAVNFPVTDVSRTTSGAPGVTTVSFSNASLGTGRSLRISVQPDAAAFTPPGGSSIPASNVSWTALGANGGIGTGGTLSSSSYALVFQSDPGRISGQVELGWALAAPGSGIRAGDHQLTIRWKVEAIGP